MRATLREIFDESAYDRFLLRTHASRSSSELPRVRTRTRRRHAEEATVLLNNKNAGDFPGIKLPRNAQTGSADPRCCCKNQKCDHGGTFLS